MAAARRKGKRPDGGTTRPGTAGRIVGNAGNRAHDSARAPAPSPDAPIKIAARGDELPRSSIRSAPRPQRAHVGQGAQRRRHAVAHRGALRARRRARRPLGGHGSTAARQHSSEADGNSAGGQPGTRQPGSRAPGTRQSGGTEARRHGGTEARRHGGTEARRYGGATARRSGSTNAAMARSNGRTAARRRGGVVARSDGRTAACLHDDAATWWHGGFVARRRRRGGIVAWRHGGFVAWRHGGFVACRHGAAMIRLCHKVQRRATARCV